MAATSAATVELADFCELDLPEPGRNYLKRAIAQGTTRNVSDGVSNVTGFIPVPTIGVSVPFESRTIEAVCLLQLAMDEDVVQIIGQPSPIKLQWVKRDGKKRTVWHTPDYLVVYKDRVALTECKPLEKLEDETKKAPDRFKKSPNGEWISPAAIRATSELGICYEVFTPVREDHTFTRNVDFLWDYLWRPLDPLALANVQRVVEYLNQYKVENLARLIREIGDVDAVNAAIAHHKVGFSWRHDLLTSPETASVYLDDVHRKALARSNIHQLTPSVESEHIKEGTTVRWLGDEWHILSTHNAEFTLVNSQHRVATLSERDIWHFVSKNEIVIEPSRDNEKENEAQKMLKETSPTALEHALGKFDRLQKWQKGLVSTLPDRTARDWLKKTEDARIRWGIPVLGLIARHKDKGNHTSMVDEVSKRLAIESIETDFTNPIARSGVTAYNLYKGRCSDECVAPVSYTTYMTYLRRADQDRQNRYRRGKRYAYQNQGPISQGLSSLPPNGDRAWEVAHIDHTPLDVELVSAITKENLGQPWLTLMVDGWSRSILASHITFLSPSRISLMMVIRDCVRRWERLPNKLIVDRGPEFQSTYFDKLLSGFNISKLLRPTAEPRFGSVGERVFGTANTNLIHQLSGNTENRVQRRGLSSSHDPSKFAVWTPDEFAKLFDKWAYEVYPTTKHRGIGETPRDRMERSQTQSGCREIARIPYTKNFLFATLPETPHGNTRKVHRGIVSIDKLEYRGLDESINRYNGQIGYTRLSPDDPSRAWIFLDEKWRELVCTNDILREYIERAIRLSHMEVSARLTKAGRRLKEIDSPLLQLLEMASDIEAKLQGQKTAPQVEPEKATTSPQHSEPMTIPMTISDLKE